MKAKIIGASILVFGCFVTVKIINAKSLAGKTKEFAMLAPEERKEDEEQPCVFMTVMGEQPSEGFAEVKRDTKIDEKIAQGESWLIKAQNKDGGWGSGSHAMQDVRDPHAVSSDPATTAMTAMALYRCGYNLETGKNSAILKKSLQYLLNEIESTKSNPDFITNVRGTQIQRKLGENIDAVLTLQFLNQVYPTLKDGDLKEKIKDAIQICINKIEKSYGADGKVKGAGWAGVLQSSFASSSLESASKNKDVKVDASKLKKSREYQKSNYNSENESVKSEDGAGIMLYAVSSSVRGSAKESQEAKEIILKAKSEGKLDRNAVLNKENLKKAGVSDEQAEVYEVADKVYNSAKAKAVQKEVMEGFGNNGGEEFLSFLQTGESMIVNKDDEWRKWYDNVGGKIISIQNSDGSWNGHHCITSPVFCTATCLMILSIENDIKKL
ncbi:MAG TPA: prenyltransferase/squalene oxidase repeat-containing protein [Flavobacterium sp.]|nr:prenyltransferase/squalene oxidase repeat-containing protein [Flavobacterium sp.]